MIELDVCDDCRWRVPTAHYVDRKGRSSRLCGRCLERALEVRTLEVKLEGMHERLRAMDRQYRRLEHERDEQASDLPARLEWFRAAWERATRENAALKARLGDDDTTIEEVG